MFFLLLHALGIVDKCEQTAWYSEKQLRRISVGSMKLVSIFWASIIIFANRVGIVIVCWVGIHENNAYMTVDRLRLDT